MRRVAPLLLLLAGCAAVPTYTSQDLAILPCETDIPRFFQPLEFNLDGTVLFADQQAAVERRVREQQPRDIVVVIHGWNKTAYVAEREYQDFLCRFHARLREAEGAAAVAYFPVRERADLLARTASSATASAGG